MEIEKLKPTSKNYDDKKGKEDNIKEYLIYILISECEKLSITDIEEIIKSTKKKL